MISICRLAAMAVLCSLMGLALAQNALIADVPNQISVRDIESVIAKARNAAIKARKPELEFEEVRLYVKQSVDGQRANGTQEINVNNADAFKAWLRDVARRTNRPYQELLDEMIAAVAPNPVPALTGKASPKTSARDQGQSTDKQSNGSSADAGETQASGISNNVAPDTSGNSVNENVLKRPGSTPRGPAGDPSAIKIDFADSATTRIKVKSR